MALVLGAVGLSPSLVSSPAHATEALTLSISSDTLALNLTPSDAAGTFGSANINIDVTMNVSGGYNLTLKGNRNDGALVGTNNPSNSFSSITGTVSADDFSAASNTQYNNKWGYKVAKNSTTNNNYKAAPTTTPDTLDTVSNFSGTNSYVLSLGARANNSTPVDSYSATFVISAVSTVNCNSNATSISEAICMQDLSGNNSHADDVINSMVEGTQYRLMDQRDGKLYYIAKMKDGRVWMTQNLDLDLISDINADNYVELNHNNTDLGWTTNDTTATWVPTSATSTNVADWGTNTNTAPASFDPGDIYYYYDKATDTATTYNNATTATADCNAAHNDGTCDHYHVGNYYNWSAAVASNDTSSISSNYTSANDSICPAGWRLPAGRTSTTSTNPGYYSEINYTWVNEGLATTYQTSSVTYGTDGWKNIRSSNMYMVAAGYKNGTSAPASTASYGYYWTNTNAYSTTSAYAPYFYSGGLYPAYNNSTSTARGRGMSIRCIARQANTGSTVITFDKNAADATGTTGTNNTQSIPANTFGNLTTNGFSRTGYAFNSWNTEPDGSGTKYADAAQFYAKAGSATTNITLYAQWDKVYTITFAIGSGASSIILDNTAYTNGQTVQLIDGTTHVIGGNYPTKCGFSSWNVTAGTLENSNAAATNYTVTGDATITLTGQEATTSISSVTVGSIPSNCKNLAVNPQLVYDPRDNEAYWVAQLCDGNIWMLDNLRLDLSDSTILNGLSESNTNASNTALNYLKGNATGTTSDQYPTGALVSSGWTNSYSVPYIKTTYKDDIAPVNYGVGSGKVGVYYNYCTASAGTYCWGNGASDTGSPTTDPNTSTSPTARDIEGDICPKGWRLPTSGSYNTTTGGGEYQNLYNKYSGATGGQAVAFRNALSTPLSGFYSGSQSSNLGTYGLFWSSTWRSTNSMYSLNVSSSNVYPSNSYNRNGGSSIRCILGSS